MDEFFDSFPQKVSVYKKIKPGHENVFLMELDLEKGDARLEKTCDDNKSLNKSSSLQ